MSVTAGVPAGVSSILRFLKLGELSQLEFEAVQMPRFHPRGQSLNFVVATLIGAPASGCSFPLGRSVTVCGF